MLIFWNYYLFYICRHSLQKGLPATRTARIRWVRSIVYMLLFHKWNYFCSLYICTHIRKEFFYHVSGWYASIDIEMCLYTWIYILWWVLIIILNLSIYYDYRSTGLQHMYFESFGEVFTITYMLLHFNYSLYFYVSNIIIRVHTHLSVGITLYIYNIHIEVSPMTDWHSQLAMYLRRLCIKMLNIILDK